MDDENAEQTKTIGIYNTLQFMPPTNDPSTGGYAVITMVPEDDDKKPSPKKLDPEIYSALNVISSELQKTIEDLEEPVYAVADVDARGTPKGSVSSDHSISVEVANPLYTLS